MTELADLKSMWTVECNNCGYAIETESLKEVKWCPVCNPDKFPRAINKQQYLANKNKPPVHQLGYAGAICGKCGEGMNHKQNKTPLFDDEKERIIKAKYGVLCDECRVSLT